MGKLDDYDRLLGGQLDNRDAERVRTEVNDRTTLLGWLGWNAQQRCARWLGEPKERADVAGMTKRLLAHSLGWAVVYVGLKSLPLNEFALFAGPAEYWALGFFGVEAIQAWVLRRLPVGTPWEGGIGAIVGLFFGIFGVLVGVNMALEAAGWNMSHRWGYRAVAACVCFGCLVGMGPGFGLRKRLLLGEVRWGEILGTWWYKTIVFFVPILALASAVSGYMWGVGELWSDWLGAAGTAAVVGFLGSTDRDGIPVRLADLVVVSIGSLVYRGVEWGVCVIGISVFLGVCGDWCWPVWASLTVFSVWAETCALGSRGYEGWQRGTLRSLAGDADLVFIAIPALLVWMGGWLGLAKVVSAALGIDPEPVLLWTEVGSFFAAAVLWSVFLKNGNYLQYLPGPVVRAVFWRRQPVDVHRERGWFDRKGAGQGIELSVRVLVSAFRVTGDVLFAVPRALTWGEAM